MMLVKYFFAIMLFFGCHCVECIERSVSTSIDGMKDLIETEEAMIESLCQYANDFEQKLKTVKSFIEKTRGEIEKSKANVEAYLSNPLNAFSLIRRLHGDWVNWKYYLDQPIGEEYLSSLKSQFLKIPTSNDIIETVNAVHRLQSTYGLRIPDMAVGLLNGKQYNVTLSALDSYTIGYELFKQSYYFEASHWIYTALASYTENDIYSALGFDTEKILQIYTETFVKQNRFEEALSVIDSVLAENPTNVNFLRRRKEIEFEVTTNLVQPNVHKSKPASDYELGCRGEFPLPTHNLYCRLNATTNAFLKLAPIKMEEVNLDPYIVLYHDVISDNEIKHLIEISRPYLRRATVYNLTDKTPIIVDSRTSKTTWLYDNETPVTERLHQRITDMTGFNLEDSEALQVMNYGLGGHYDAHYDFFNTSIDEEDYEFRGDRISTVLFYMSNVEQGGATVFPRLKIAVSPQKGSAVMWYNLDNRGDGDERTFHAACPVIVGSKWVANKWIRERNQFRARPCV